jgi:hypothetical protein
MVDHCGAPRPDVPDGGGSRRKWTNRIPLMMVLWENKFQEGGGFRAKFSSGGRDGQQSLYHQMPWIR